MANLKNEDTGLRADAEGGISGVSSEPAYPPGTKLYLDESTLTKLNLLSLPQIGDALNISGRVVVVGAHQEDATGSTKNRRLELQITDLDIEPVEGKPQGEGKIEQVLYGA